jgi:hypothetical protein
MALSFQFQWHWLPWIKLAGNGESVKAKMGCFRVRKSNQSRERERAETNGLSGHLSRALQVVQKVETKPCPHLVGWDRTIPDFMKSEMVVGASHADSTHARQYLASTSAAERA